MNGYFLFLNSSTQLHLQHLHLKTELLKNQISDSQHSPHSIHIQQTSFFLNINHKFALATFGEHNLWATRSTQQQDLR